MSRHDDSTRTLTIREAWDQHYPKSDLAPRSHFPFKGAINAWEWFTDNPPIHLIANATVEAGLEPVTVNNYWGHLRSIFGVSALRQIAIPGRWICFSAGVSRR